MTAVLSRAPAASSGHLAIRNTQRRYPCIISRHSPATTVSSFLWIDIPRHSTYGRGCHLERGCGEWVTAPPLLKAVISNTLMFGLETFQLGLFNFSTRSQAGTAPS
ncbi:hypothetical protein CLAIMM_12558 [Cladophialophora immunda]|nr:hypothetical protein CLAIMM_12558 [Cladophialophora immunda]